MCIACRKQADENELMKFARAPDGTVAFDIRARLPGRGAWLCASLQCLKTAQKRNAFSRAFQNPTKVDEQDLCEQINSSLKKTIADNLGLAMRAQKIISGRDEVRRIGSTGSLFAVLLAKDLSSAESIEKSFEKLFSSQIIHIFSKEFFAFALGRAPTGVVGLQKARITMRIVFDVRKYISFFDDTFFISSEHLQSLACDEGAD